MLSSTRHIASSWDGQLFNVNQAQAIANRSLSFLTAITTFRSSSRSVDCRPFAPGLPDVTDSNATPPSLAQPSTPPSSTPLSKSTPVGAIAGGVAGGVVFLGFVLLLLWYMCYYRKKVHHAHWHRAHVDLNAEDGEKPLESPPVTAAFSNAGNNMGAVNAMPYDPYAQHHQMQMQQGYTQMQAATYPGAPGFAPMTLASMSSTTHSSPPPPQGGARPVTIQTYPLSGGGGDARRIPTVAEQLSEKRRIREERTRPSAARPPPSAFQGLHNNSSGTGASVSVDESGVLTYTGHHSRGMSSVSGLSASGNGSTSNFESQTHSPSNSQTSSTMHLPSAVRKSSLDNDAGGGEQHQQQQQGQVQPQTRKASRRLSLAKAPWNRRRPAVSEPASSVVGDAEDVGDGQHDVSAQNQSLSQSPTSPTSTQRRAAVEDVLATVPGARMPSARDREQPPPSYVSVPNVTDMALLSLPGARRMTVMNEAGDDQ